MTEYKHVFSPSRIGKVQVKNRIETAPMLSGMASPGGFVTREMIEFYQAFARGGAGIVTVGDSAVDDDFGKGHHGQLNLGDDRIIGGLSTMAEAIQKYGAKISIELNHAGMLASPRVLGGRYPIGPSARTTEEGQITEMSQGMIDQVVANYASASHRCLMAGFEMVLVHGAHGCLMGQFLSPNTNKRTDGYGGNLENRARFAIEILTAIREMVGDRLALEFRVSGDELIAEGMHQEETIELIRMIQDKIDLVHVSLGVVYDPRYIIQMAQPNYFPHAHNVHRAEKMKQAVSIPVTCVGSIISLEMAESIIAEGKADIVAMGRPHIADPDIVNKSYRGQLDDIRPCLRCNVCGERPGAFFPVRCAVNPVAGREVEYNYIRPAEKRKKVVVVGGGPAGMEAAITAADRGHQVTLFEKESELGGALRYAAAPPFKADMKRFLDWMINKVRRSPVEIKLATPATADSVIDEQPEVLVLAVGAEPVIPDIPGINKPNTVWAGDVDLGNAATGETVVVAGAGLTGCETALHLAQQGKKVTVVDMISQAEIAQDTSFVGRITLMGLLQEHGVVFRTEVTLEEITDKGIAVTDGTGRRSEMTADTVVLSLGVKPLSATVQALQGLVREVHVIGDCSTPHNLMAAIHDGFNVTAEL